MTETLERWQRVTAQIPSRWFTSPAVGAEGFRFSLAEHAARSHPLRYLEIGCRRGHSLAMVLLSSPRVDIVCVVDPWVPDYGDEMNFSSALVMRHLASLGIPESVLNRVVFIPSSSHTVLPSLPQEPTFNLILVDGDHTPEGAAADLRDCYPLLEPGGVLVFDDAIGDLLNVWREFCRTHDLRATEHLDGVPPWCEAVK